MHYFYRKNEPIPVNLFHPRWLIDGPSVVRSHWEIRLNNRDFSTGEPLEVQDFGDRFVDAGEQLIIDRTITVVERLKNLPPGEKEPFALALKKAIDSLISRHEEKLRRLETFPWRLPDRLVQLKVTFILKLCRLGKR